MHDIISTIALPKDIDTDVDQLAKMLNITKEMMLRIIILQGLGHQDRAKRMMPISRTSSVPSQKQR